ncbi:hypothetical protein O77CONTIG1_03373 [Leptolyngbya sp. O-77]|nr:hypothetical protein O77CONTIG1_03373 [Leptolyngbya sp. O-77]
MSPLAGSEPRQAQSCPLQSAGHHYSLLIYTEAIAQDQGFRLMFSMLDHNGMAFDKCEFLFEFGVWPCLTSAIVGLLTG